MARRIWNGFITYILTARSRCSRDVSACRCFITPMRRISVLLFPDALPTWLYGWQAVNYNGASMRYQGRVGNWSAIVSLFGGSEHSKDIGYGKFRQGAQSLTNVNWTNILGADLTLSRTGLKPALCTCNPTPKIRPSAIHSISATRLTIFHRHWPRWRNSGSTDNAEGRLPELATV